MALGSASPSDANCCLPPPCARRSEHGLVHVGARDRQRGGENVAGQSFTTPSIHRRNCSSTS